MGPREGILFLGFCMPHRPRESSSVAPAEILLCLVHSTWEQTWFPSSSCRESESNCFNQVNNSGHFLSWPQESTDRSREAILAQPDFDSANAVDSLGRTPLHMLVRKEAARPWFLLPEFMHNMTCWEEHFCGIQQAAQTFGFEKNTSGFLLTCYLFKGLDV